MPVRKRFGIARKLFIAFTVVAIIPLAVALVVSIAVLLSQADLAASEVLWGKVRLAQLYYDGRRDNMKRALEAASRNTAILVNMELSLDFAVVGTLTEIASSQNLDGVWVFKPDGSLFASANSMFPFGDAARLHASGEDPMFSVLEQKSGTAYLMGTKPLVSGRGETIGYLSAVIDMSRFCAEATASVKTPVFILLDSGLILFDPGFPNGDTAEFKILDIKKAKNVNGTAEQRRGTIGGKKYLISIVPVTEAITYSMRLGVAYPESMISGPRNREVFLIVLTSLFAVLLASFGGNYFRDRIIVPVLSVADAARVIAGGVYGNTVDIGTQDEIGALALDFNRMSERLYSQGKEREKAERVIEESLREKETLLREIHHRVKNNFQIINSLFDLQLMNTENETVQDSLKEPKARIHAMALIHDRLYLSENFSSLDFADYVTELAQDLFYGYNVDPSRISLDIDADSVFLDMDRSIPCGLILNELMTNALKHAFPDPLDRGKISVILRKSESVITLCVSDDGAGFAPAEMSRSAGTLGLTLVHILCDQIKGSFSIDTVKGVKATVSFPY